MKEARAVDAIYAQDPVSVGVPALLVSRLFRKPFLVRLGGDYAWEQGQQRFGVTALLDAYTKDKASAPWQVRALAKVQRFVVCHAKKVIVPSEYMKSIVSTWGVSDANLQVIYSALFPLQVEQSVTELRESLGYSGTVLFSAARLTPWKGFEVLLEVVASMIKTHSDLMLVIAGDGPEQGYLEAKAQELGIAKSVTFAGRLSKEELGKRLKASDVFVLNTAYEGLSHQLLEVMAIGVPMVTTTAGGNPELITDGVTGLTVDYNDAETLEEAIERVLHTDDLRTRMIAQAKVRTQDFNQDKVVAQLVTMFETYIW